MKKVLTYLFAIGIISAGLNPTFANPQTPPANFGQKPPSREMMRQKFEQRLNLTDKQKEQAKAIHKKGREQMKPIMEQIIYKRQEIDAISKTKMLERAKQEQIAEITTQIRELEKKANEIRKANSQEFESILTKKQKNELAKMKAEGRAEFEKNHPARPPFQGLGTPAGLFMPSFTGRPLFPPPAPDFTNK